MTTGSTPGSTTLAPAAGLAPATQATGIEAARHRVWKLGADIDTDLLAPGYVMKHGIDVIATHCLETVRPEFAAQVRPGDVIAAGPNFGIGSSREQAAASVLRGRKVANGVRLIVAPASLRDQEAAQASGDLQILRDAGAELYPTSCGACAGYGSPMNDGDVVISTTARNFKGRMGSATAKVYLASPYTVAASALRGSVTDPREVLA